jgi:hypothetical protein
MLHLECSFVWWWNWDTSESGSEITWKVSHLVLEKDGEDQLNRSCEKLRSVSQSQEEMEYPTYSTNKEG